MYITHFIRLLLLFIFTYSTPCFADDAEKLRHLFQRFFTPIQHDVSFLTEKSAEISLGRQLFFDVRLSEKQNISCNSCHNLSRYGTNGDYFLALKKQGLKPRDVPSVYNNADFDLFGWTGQQTQQQAKIKHSLESNIEMGQQGLSEVVNRLKKITGYQSLFQQVYPTQQLTEATLISALKTFMQGLVTPAPIDQFIAGDNNALTAKQIAGGLMFDQRYCHSCHTGTNFGGRMIQKMGVKEPWPNQQDLGLYVDTKSISDKMFFRVSPLRNVEKTAPYFHDGSSKRMWDAVKKMGRYELGLDISMSDALSIQHFLKTLTGKLPEQYIAKPKLPK